MGSKAVVSLATGLEDPEKVSVALLMAVGAAGTGRETVVFAAEEAVRLALEGTAVGTACAGCPPLTSLVDRFLAAGGRWFVCPVCSEAEQLDAGLLVKGAELASTIPLWTWIGDEGATPSSY